MEMTWWQIVLMILATTVVVGASFYCGMFIATLQGRERLASYKRGRDDGEKRR